MTSAYPLTVAELTDRVRAHATRIQGWPSLRQIMADHHVGRAKATAAVESLRATGFNPVTSAAMTSEVATDTAADDQEQDATVPALRVVPIYHPADDTADRTVDDPADHMADDVNGGATDDPGEDPAVSASEPVTDGTDALTTAQAPALAGAATDASDTASETAPARGRFAAWPLILIGLGAFVSIWGGWVGLGELTGFGPIRLLPGIADDVVLNSAITLPIGVEAYAAYALRVWLGSAALSDTARRFARASAVGALVLGAAGQIAYHLMDAAGITRAPWPITAFVSCLPVVVLGCAAALTHLIHRHPATVGKENA